MRILTSITASNNFNASSPNADTVIIGSSGSENNDANVDNLTVWANADFKNNVIVGSNLNDTLTIKSLVAPITGGLIVSGVINTVSGGIKFPDGTVQLSAATTGSFDIRPRKIMVFSSLRT